MKTACKRMITQQVSEILRIEIEDGDLYPGTKIPTDTELAEMFGVQKQIVRTAIEVLVKEGLLKYISDKEVYVLGHKIERNMERDREVTQRLKAEGWTVLRFWGKDIKQNVAKCADEIIAVILKK